MNKIVFKTSPAQRIYNDYMARVTKSIAVLSKTDRDEMTMELNSHIHEAVSRADSENELDVLLDVTAGLGVPEEFLKPLVARKKLDQAVHSFNPKHVFQAITLNLKNGLIYTLFGLLYLFLITFACLIVAKIFFPVNTGLFISNGSFRGFGFISGTDGMTEVLGYWIIPVSAVAALVLYACITLLLRATRRP
jgi:uncharacterized membrane protein